MAPDCQARTGKRTLTIDSDLNTDIVRVQAMQCVVVNKSGIYLYTGNAHKAHIPLVK